ncbi:MAG: tail fiber domain-containing protein, partial [Candidatus Gastranaerophilales bacterium]|nr:tail fiber domain-containing protein [Candidatus Gastranaerophilales bacterium]
CQSLNTSSPYSDRRLKNISSKNTAGLDEINNLKIYNYTFKDDDKKLPRVGVMAQDLLKVFPNSVFKGDDGYLRIKWDEMFYATINAIKELDRKIIALVKRTTTVETQISKLEKENLLLKSQVDNLTLRVNKLKAQ